MNPSLPAPLPAGGRGGRTYWSFQTAGQLVFGSQTAGRVGELISRLRTHTGGPIGRVLVITDPTLVGIGIYEPIGRSLEAAKLEIGLFDGGRPEPAIDVALAAIDVARDFQPDAILGLGGGSNLDLAKIVSCCFTHGGYPRDYFGFDNVPGPVTTLIGVPTTAGTGSEVSHAAVITDAENKIKVSTLSQRLRPALAVVDPELTMTCPPKVTADSGIDALTHAIEAYTAVSYMSLDGSPGVAHAYEGSHPIGECLAEPAIEMIGRQLVNAVHEPDNAAARHEMALAATLAGIAFSNCGVALVHALEYPIGGAVHCSHGAGNGLLLPYVMKFNLPECEQKYARIARLLYGGGGRNNKASAYEAISIIEDLRKKIGIPTRLRELGVRQEQLPLFAAKAFAIKRLMTINPRRASEEDLLEILRSAY